MMRILKYITLAAIVLLVFGVLLGGTGLLTGASPERVWRALDAHGHLDAVKSAAEWARGAWESIRAVF